MVIAPSRPHHRWLPMLALASGAALVLLVGHALSTATADAVERARGAAIAVAQGRARELQRRLASPEVLTIFPPAERFTLRNGKLVVPDALGWLHPRSPSPVPATVAAQVRRAQSLEASGQHAAAVALLESAVAELATDAPERLPLALAAGWTLLRSDDPPRATEAWQHCTRMLSLSAVSAFADPCLGELLIGSTLLGAALGNEVPAELTASLTALPAGELAPVFARMTERGLDVDELATAARAANAWRERLLRVDARIERDRTDAQMTRLGDELLLWFPQHGEGALIPLLHAALAADPDWRGYVGGDSGAVDAAIVVDGLTVRPATAPPLPLLARPAIAWSAATLLIALCAGSAWLSWRGLRRHAAAVAAEAEFLTVVTHELKTPVASIRLIAEVLGNDEASATRARDYVALLGGESARLQMLVENVLDLGQRERGERRLDRRPMDLVPLLRETVASFVPLAERAGMKVELAAPVAAFAAVDGLAITQAIANLLDNASKYAGGGRRLLVTMTAAGEVATIIVRDFGMGVPAAERDSIFTRFQRGSAHRHGSIPGVGIGLHLARQIVRGHDGELSCRAPMDGGAGAEFVLTLPVCPPEDPA